MTHAPDPASSSTNDAASGVVERRFHALLDAAPDAMIIVDHEGRITLANKQAESVFGYTREELLGQRVEILVPLPYREGHSAHRFHYAENPHTRPMGAGLDLYARRRDGTDFPAEISLSPLFDPQATLYMAAIRDVTDRKRAEAKLRQTAEELARSNAELEQFAYVASHDLQEPLRMVASYTQLLGRRYKGRLDEDADEFIGFAVSGAQRMQNLINDLLAYSRVGTRSQPFEWVDCTALVDSVIGDLAAQIAEAHATVTRGPDLPSVLVDPSQLRQVFQNLVANALKFHAPDRAPRVHVKAEKSGTDWVFAIEDNGIGIEPQYAERIFQLFQRLHSQAEYPGTGIGLAICKKIIERHGGRIWLESKPGEGTTFFFTIPVERRSSQL